MRKAKHDGDKELKVKVPARLHLQLHSLKLMEGKPIQKTVAEALDEYFQRARAAHDANISSTRSL